MGSRIKKSLRHISMMVCLVAFIVVVVVPCQASPTYVFYQKDGTIRFSNKPPTDGTQAKVFSARKSTFSWYHIAPHYGGADFSKLYGATFDTLIQGAARSTGVTASLIKAVIHAESGFNVHAVSPKGAQGLMQLMPSTARDVGVRNSYSAEENIRGGAKYLKMLITRYRGNLEHALAAYNAGMESVEKYRGIPPFEETQKYVKIVTKLQTRYKSIDG